MAAVYYYYYTDETPSGDSGQSGGTGGKKRPPLFPLLSAVISMCAGIIAGLQLLDDIPALRRHEVVSWSVYGLSLLVILVVAIRSLWISASARRRKTDDDSEKREEQK